MRIRIGPSLLAILLCSGLAAAQAPAQKPSRDWKRVAVDNLEVVGNASAMDLTAALTQVVAGQAPPRSGRGARGGTAHR